MDPRTKIQIFGEEGGLLNWWHHQFIFDGEYDPIVEVFVSATISMMIYGIAEKIFG